MLDTLLSPSTPVDDALVAWSESFDHLLKALGDGGLDHYDDDQLLVFAQDVERLRNRLALVDHRIVAEVNARSLGERRCQGSTNRLMCTLLQISRAEAARRVRAEAACGPRLTVQGQPLAPLRETLAAAVADGDVSSEQTAVIERALASVDHRGFDPADLDAGEKILVDYARTAGPEDLRRLAQQVVDGIDPDGTRPSEDLNQDRRAVELVSQRDGSWCLRGRLTGSCGAKLKSLLEPLSKPQVDPTGAPGADSARGEPPARSSVDERHRVQRVHDALDELCSSVLTRGERPGPGGAGSPATLVITIGLDDLVEGTGFGRTSDGTLLRAAEVLEQAAAADLLPVFLNRNGALLGVGQLGRRRRIATRAQSLALTARDGGCSFPGCDRDPQWCERHHIIAWINGGLTDLENLNLLCRYHHHNFEAKGWTCRLNDLGLPEWRPPRWIDRWQRPLVNQRILATHRGRAPRRVPATERPTRSRT